MFFFPDWRGIPSVGFPCRNYFELPGVSKTPNVIIIINAIFVKNNAKILFCFIWLRFHWIFPCEEISLFSALRARSRTNILHCCCRYWTGSRTSLPDVKACTESRFYTTSVLCTNRVCAQVHFRFPFIFPWLRNEQNLYQKPVKNKSKTGRKCPSLSYNIRYPILYVYVQTRLKQI